MIIDFLKFLIPYVLGMNVTFLIFHPVKEWQDGYNTAKEFYNDWNLGFDDGYNCAKNRFKNYDDGFGDGFESGWDAALKYYKKEEK